MRRTLRSISVFLLMFALLFELAGPAFAADTAAAMQLSKTEGTVTVANASARTLTILENMRLYNGYTVKTAAASYAWINLDSAKLIKLDASTEVEIRKSGKKLEVFVKSGSVYGDVSEKLASDETLNVRTSTAIVGIRGTKFQVSLSEEETDANAAARTYIPKKPPNKINMKGAGKVDVACTKGLVEVRIEDINKVQISANTPQITMKDPSQLVLDRIQNTLQTLGSSTHVNVSQTGQTGSGEGNSSVRIEVSAGQTLSVSEGASTGTTSIGLTNTTPDDLRGSALVELTRDGDYTLTASDGATHTITPEQAAARLAQDQKDAEEKNSAGTGTEQNTGAANTDNVWTGSTDSGSGKKPDSSGGSGNSGSSGGSGSTRTYIVSYATNGGSHVSWNLVEEGRTASRPANPTREGYVFTGWFADAACTIAFDFSTPITGDVTVYAGWEEVPAETYVVTFNANGGEGGTSVTVEDGQTVAEPAVPTREGYVFTGWYADAACTETFDFSTPITGDVTVYAGWEEVPADTYVVTFDANGGEGGTSVTVEEGQTVARPASPIREGYTFTGWYTDTACTTFFDFTAPVTGDVTVYAGWEEVPPETYVVTFNANGGEGGTSVTVEDGQTVAEPAVPTREGYVFTGWYADAACTETFDFSTPITGDVTVYAGWEEVPPETYVVTFNANGGEGGTSVTVEDGQTVARPASPIREGYTFTGWYTDTACTTFFNFTAPVTGDVTVYAGWEEVPPETYTVTFNANGGTGGTSVTVEEGQTVSRPASPTRSGYTFTGWYTNAACTTSFSFSTPITGDTTVYAGWKVVTVTPPTPSTPKYTVTFDANGGEGGTSVTVEEGKTATAPSDPTRLGFTFDGWFTNEGCTTKWNASTPVTENITVYAGWTEKTKYTVTFDKNDSTGTLETKSAYDGDTVTKPTDDPTRTGYTFGGWYKEEACTTAWDFSTDTVTGNVTLYAKWTKEYTVTFDANGGNGGPTSPSTTTDWKLPALPATADEPTREGYTFAGWYTADTGGDPVTTDTVFKTNSTVYAHWTKQEYTITFNANGGNGGPTSTSTTKDWKLTALPTPEPTREGYKFDGWYTAQTGGDPVTTDTVFTADTTVVYAHWKKLPTVTFSLGGGGKWSDGSTADKTIVVNENYLIPADKIPEVPTSNDPDKSVFYSWSYPAAGAMCHPSALSTRPFTVPAELTAQWKIPYTVNFHVFDDTTKQENVTSVKTKEEDILPFDMIPKVDGLIGWTSSAGDQYEFTADAAIPNKLAQSMSSDLYAMKSTSTFVLTSANAEAAKTVLAAWLESNEVGTIDVKTSGDTADSVTLAPNDIDIPAGKTVNLGENVELSAYAVTIKGTLNVATKATLTVAGGCSATVSGNGSIVNAGIIGNNSGGTITVTENGSITNETGGEITNSNGSTIDISSANGKIINNGTINNGWDGTILNSGNITNNKDITNSNTIISGGTITNNSTITNSGTVACNGLTGANIKNESTGSAVDVSVNGTELTVNLSSDITTGSNFISKLMDLGYNVILAEASNGTPVNFNVSSDTISKELTIKGNVTVTVESTLTNEEQGKITILADGSLDVKYFFGNKGEIDNAGTITTSNSQQLSNSGTITNTGSISCGNGINNTGTITNNGTITGTITGNPVTT